MQLAQRRLLLLACAAACSSAADAPALVSRIREHMREYVAHLPDYTCRITLERFRRPKTRAPFDLSDRLRLEVAYTGGQELYSWPGDDRFEAGIEDLLPGHGMVSNGSYALHVRNLFVRDVAEFSAPHDERCEGRPCVRLDFQIPAVRSGYSLSAGNGSAPAPLVGSAWFDAAEPRYRRAWKCAWTTRRAPYASPPRGRPPCTSGPASAMWSSWFPELPNLIAARSRWQRAGESFALRPVPSIRGNRDSFLCAARRHSCSAASPAGGGANARETGGSSLECRNRRRRRYRRPIHGDHGGWRAGHRPYYEYASRRQEMGRGLEGVGNDSPWGSIAREGRHSPHLEGSISRDLLPTTSSSSGLR